jgi:two-component system response regulator DegU
VGGAISRHVARSQTVCIAQIGKSKYNMNATPMIDLYVVRANCASDEPLMAVLDGEPDFNVRGCTERVDVALQQLQRHPCDVVLVSYELGEEAAFKLVGKLLGQEPPAKVLLTDVPKEDEVILHFVEEGAAGYVCADESWADLVKKIRAVAEDEFLVHPDIAATMMARIAELNLLLIELDGGNRALPDTAYAELTQREVEVLRLLGEEKSNQEIAQALTIELGTVKNHVHNLLRKLDVCSRKHAAQLARQMLPQ